MIRFQFVDDSKKNHSVKRLCEVLKLNRSSYYKWKKTSTIRKKRLISDAVLGARVKAVFIKERGCYGSKRITAARRSWSTCPASTAGASTLRSRTAPRWAATVQSR